MTHNAATRTASGRFAPGTSGNPAGSKRGPRTNTMQQRLEGLLKAKGPVILERAFEVARTDDEVLAGLLNYLAASQAAHNIATLAIPPHGTQQ
jgi:hypothetical protein